MSCFVTICSLFAHYTYCRTYDLLCLHVFMHAFATKMGLKSKRHTYDGPAHVHRIIYFIYNAQNGTMILFDDYCINT